ncbi:glycoside hydrolase family 43 protein [Clostridium grantii]|uniref:Xylan 1,4-beta-xylosidase n=1 Tax=Clostridium grantii DSM 8605 TaxID=1121316 RepID=A0A1M5T423_9CLOT|nr:glycoside hydrolase family 43 protein [Clostridium grantii]SHH45456.1 xylan 1,4-beta-xylosidase [Clostridium grantii DSM 8605]
MLENPIISGFNPDPSIIRVGEDYYIATSTFEWFPGIPIYKSKDLKNWELFTHVVTKKEQIDLRGIDSALGIWAPALSYDKVKERFYMCFSVINGATNNNFDVNNYLMYTNDITAEWSMPIYLNSSGFDPALFHDDDGKKWIVNLEWDFRKGYEHPGAIVIEEYDPINEILMGGATRIFKGGTDRGCQEGPQIYKRNNYYYLVTAEGGTGYGHGVVVSRAENIKGPYKTFDRKPIITSQPEDFNERGVEESMKIHRFNPESYLQRAGHGNIVETQNGEVYVTHLCSRPILPEIRSILGRETAIQKCRWTKDNWLELDSDDNLAKRFVQQPNLEEVEVNKIPDFDDFDKPNLTIDYYTLREPQNSSWLSLEKESMLRIKGRDTLFSRYDQSFIAKKLKYFNNEIETLVFFNPENFLEMAGLTCFYNNSAFYYLRLYYSESLKSQCLGIMINDNGYKDELLEHRVPIMDGGKGVYMKAIIKNGDLQFYYALKKDQWQKIGPILDASILSDEYAHGFTGAFAGITVQDLYKKSKWAEFEYFSLKKQE